MGWISKDVFLSLLCNSFFLQEQVAYDDPDKKIYHLCIVNLVIGLVSFYFMSCVNNRIILGPDVQSTINMGIKD